MRKLHATVALSVCLTLLPGATIVAGNNHTNAQITSARTDSGTNAGQSSGVSGAQMTTGTAVPVVSTTGQDAPVDTETQEVTDSGTAVVQATEKTANDPNQATTITVLGVTWDATQNETRSLQMRTKHSGSEEWSEWSTVPTSDDATRETDQNAIGSTEAVVVSAHEIVEIRSDGPVEITTSRTQQTQADREIAGAVQDTNEHGQTQTTVQGVGLMLSPDEDIREVPYTGAEVPNNNDQSTVVNASAAGTAHHTGAYSASTVSAATQGGQGANQEAFAAQNVAEIGGIEYVTRKQWGAKKARCEVDTAKRNSGVVIHHTDGANGYKKEDVPGILRGIQAYHQQGRGWCDIGYNMLIDRFGNAYEGRTGLDKATVGAHAAAVNYGTFGVSVIGTYNKKVPQEVVHALARVVAWQAKKWGWKVESKTKFTSAGGPGAKWGRGKKVTLPRVTGHRDVGFTECPGDGIYNQLGKIRTLAANGGLPPTQGAIGAFHKANAKATGKPVDHENGGLKNGGYYQSFENGAVHWSPKTGAHLTLFDSPIHQEWAKRKYENGPLGYPIAEQKAEQDQLSQRFEGGTITWTKKDGVQVSLTTVGDATDTSG